jgi:hypothetical protein
MLESRGAAMDAKLVCVNAIDVFALFSNCVERSFGDLGSRWREM